MNELRKILTPLSWVFDGITKTRNTLYDKGVLKSHEFEIPLIVVGNLRVGGTGKTPMVAYLVKILKDRYQIAVLSRGYKRKTSGFILADKDANAEILGDEPYQLFCRYPDILIAVDEDRAHGINQLLQLKNPPELVILDDAFQHRQVKADFNILLTPYDDLYVDDTLLPAGNLRENISGADRAQIIVVTKSPEELTEQEQFETVKRLKSGLTQTVFFTTIKYRDEILNQKTAIKLLELRDYEVVLLTGIANPKPLLDYLNSQKITYSHLAFPDHHTFSESNLKAINQAFNEIKTNKKLILTTEKDYVRIFTLPNFRASDLYYLAIETQFVQYQDDFDKMIIHYVEQSTGNRSIS